MRFEVLQSEWFRLVMGSFASAGVTDVICSPGSRSVPLVAAALSDPRLHLEAYHDERSASFFALGLARASGRPVLLIRTSGTASAHDFPAVIEAHEDHVPLIVVSADRPLELQDGGAPQTIDQRHLFGRFVRSMVELGVADSEAFGTVPRKVAQAVFDARHPVPGPVHVNAPARKPLAWTVARESGELELADWVQQRTVRPCRWVASRRSFGPAALAMVADDVRRAPRGAVVAGSRAATLDQSGIIEFVTRSGYVLLPELGSQLRRQGSPHIVDDFEHRPIPELTYDVVITVGRHPSSRILQEVIRRAETVLAVDEHRPPDPEGRATASFVGPVNEWFRQATSLFEDTADEATPEVDWTRVERALETAPFSEGHAVRAVAAVLPGNASVVLGNSLPVRLVDRFVPAAMNPGWRVFAQRGANGIDGQVSGAAGVALDTEGPTVALLGDVTALHDLGGLGLAARSRTPLVLVVLDNAGGRIFEELAWMQREPDPRLVELTTTPHDWDLTKAAQMFGMSAATVDSEAALSGAMGEALQRQGATLIRVVVQPGALRQVQASWS